jgi:hypothetical protein
VAPAAGPPAGSRGELTLEFVDHANLRDFPRDPGALEREAVAVEAGIADARAWGAERYVLFTRDFEDLILYDDAARGLGLPLPRPEGSTDRAVVLANRTALARLAGEARSAGMGLSVHTNQLDFPDDLVEAAGSRLGPGGVPCALGDATWPLVRAKVHELYEAAPELDGLVLTADEAPYPVWDCGSAGAPGAGDPSTSAALAASGPSSESVAAAVTRLITETALAAAAHDRLVDVRAWGRVEAMPGVPPPDDLPPNIRISTKDTDGDFQLFSAESPLLAGPVDVVEVDAWGEYSGWNYFPVYMGDIWAPRVRRAAGAGAASLAVRVNWAEANPIFGRPWGNLVNLALARGLAADPDADPDALLRAWIAARWPANAAEDAFTLYKRSAPLVRTMTSVGSVETTDHSRAFRTRDSADAYERARDSLDRAQAEGKLLTAADFDARRKEVAAAEAEALALVEALPDSVPNVWRSELERGARALGAIGRLTTEQLALAHWQSVLDDGPGSENRASASALLTRAAADIQRIAEAWHASDPESYDTLLAEEAVLMANQAGERDD